MNRAYSIFQVKSVDDEQRIVEGIASTPDLDRGGDEMDPKGAKFVLPMPFKWQHKNTVGRVISAVVTSAGIQIRAQLPKISEPGLLKDSVDLAWQSMKYGLTTGFSIGWNPLEATRNSKGGLKVSLWEWLETSGVDIPMNANCTIQLVKSLDSEHAASGTEAPIVPVNSPGASGTVRVVQARQAKSVKKTIQEQIKDFENTRAAIVAERDAILDGAMGKGLAMDAQETEQYDDLDAQVKTLDDTLKRLKARESEIVATAKPANGNTPEAASVSRGVQPVHVQVQDTTDKGIGFARAVLCKTASFIEFQKGVMKSPLEFARERYPSDMRVQKYLQTKTAVAAGTTTDATWAEPLLADPTNLAGDFLEYLRPETIIGKFGTTVNGVAIPPLRRVPFNVRIQAQSVGGSASWVGQGKGKPVTKFGFTDQTLLFTKIAAICVITEELARFSTPSAEALVRDQLKEVVVERMDSDFIDPSITAISGVRPASITNGVTVMTSAGTSAANVLTDVQNLLEPFILAKMKTTRLVIIMPETLAMVLSLQLNSLGQRAFPDIETGGGKLAGIPVITTQYAASGASYGNMVIALNTADIALADDGVVTVDASREASIEMSDAPTNESATPTANAYMVSMFQSNSIALRAERFVNWATLRSGAVAYYDDVNWGSIGSPY